MMRVSRIGWTAYLIAITVLVLDQASKYWIMEILKLPEYGTQEVLWPLQFTRIWNRGVSFGLLQAGHDAVRWGMVAFNLGVALILINWVRKGQLRMLAAIGYGMLIGGAIGNAIDRAIFGAVIDFVDVTRLGFFPWIFNVADAGITVGVILFLLDTLRGESKAGAVGQ
jgi:signal peptidase II